MPKKSLEFHAGIAISEFDKDCGESPIGRMEFHYHVAMRKLCEGDRAGAIEYFDRCTKSSLIDGGYYHVAKAFKRLLEENPHWANNPVRGRPLDGVESGVLRRCRDRSIGWSDASKNCGAVRHDIQHFLRVVATAVSRPSATLHAGRFTGQMRQM